MLRLGFMEDALGVAYERFPRTVREGAAAWQACLRRAPLLRLARSARPGRDQREPDLGPYQRGLPDRLRVHALVEGVAGIAQCRGDRRLELAQQDACARPGRISLHELRDREGSLPAGDR